MCSNLLSNERRVRASRPHISYHSPNFLPELLEQLFLQGVRGHTTGSSGNVYSEEKMSERKKSYKSLYGLSGRWSEFSWSIVYRDQNENVDKIDTERGQVTLQLNIWEAQECFRRPEILILYLLKRNRYSWHCGADSQHTGAVYKHVGCEVHMVVYGNVSEGGRLESVKKV